MFAEIFFGIISSIVIYFVLKVLFEEYDDTNIYLYYLYGIIFLIISGLILIFRFPLSRIISNIYYWNSLLISTFVIALLIGIYILSKKAGETKKK